MTRVRATFLLRCVILAACVALFLGVLSLGAGTGWTVGALVFAAVLWFVGIEGGVLPWVIERVVVQRASRRGVPVDSIWFVDLRQQRSRELERFHDDTRDNPTIR